MEHLIYILLFTAFLLSIYTTFLLEKFNSELKFFELDGLINIDNFVRIANLLSFSILTVFILYYEKNPKHFLVFIFGLISLIVPTNISKYLPISVLAGYAILDSLLKIL